MWYNKDVVITRMTISKGTLRSQNNERMCMSLLPLKDAARVIGVPYPSVLHHYKQGRIPTQQVGRYHLIDPVVLQAVLQAYCYHPRQK